MIGAAAAAAGFCVHPHAPGLRAPDLLARDFLKNFVHVFGFRAARPTDGFFIFAMFLSEKFKNFVVFRLIWVAAELKYA